MKQITISILLFFLGFIFFGAYSLLGIDLHHDGIMFKAAVDVADGCKVFKEVFSQYGILPPLFQGLALKIFGYELIVLKLLTAFFYGLSLVVFDLVMRRFFNIKEDFYRVFYVSLFFFLSPDLCVTSHPWASVYALFFLLVTMHLTLCFWENKENNLKFAIVSGITTAIIFGFRQPCGLTTILAVIAITIILFSLNAKEAKKFVLGYILGLFPILIIYALAITYWGAWHHYWIQTWSNAFSFAINRGAGSGTWGGIMMNFFPIVSEDRGFFDAIYAFFPIITLLFLAKEILTHRWKENVLLTVVIIYSLSAWHQYYPVPCVRHIFWASIPMIGIFVLAIKYLFQNGGIKGKIVIAILLLMLFFPVAMRCYFGVVRLQNLIICKSVNLPGLRGMRLFAYEKEVCFAIYNLKQSIPSNIIKRGVFNHTPDGIWSVLLPSCKLKHPLFCRLAETAYPDYDKYAFNYCMKNKPMVISTVWEWLPGYIKLQEFSYNGLIYYILRPLN